MKYTRWDARSDAAICVVQGKISEALNILLHNNPHHLKAIGRHIKDDSFIMDIMTFDLIVNNIPNSIQVIKSGIRDWLQGSAFDWPHHDSIECWMCWSCFRVFILLHLSNFHSSFLRVLSLVEQVFVPSLNYIRYTCIHKTSKIIKWC